MSDDQNSDGPPNMFSPTIGHWTAFVEAWRTDIEPLRDRRADHLKYAVSYGQLALRSIILLNGGGLLAAPAFAQMFGSIWSQGFWPPTIAMVAFTLGLICAVGATIFSFLGFLKLQVVSQHEINRTAKRLRGLYKTLSTNEPPPDQPTGPTPEEKSAQKDTNFHNFWAIFLGLMSFGLFITGAILGAYVLAGGGPPLVDGG